MGGSCPQLERWRYICFMGAVGQAWSGPYCLVIASPAKPDVAIQLDCFVVSLLAMTGLRVMWSPGRNIRQSCAGFRRGGRSGGGPGDHMTRNPVIARSETTKQIGRAHV